MPEPHPIAELRDMILPGGRWVTVSADTALALLDCAEALRCRDGCGSAAAVTDAVAPLPGANWRPLECARVRVTAGRATTTSLAPPWPSSPPPDGRVGHEK